MPSNPPANDHILEQIVTALKTNSTFSLSGHQGPDGDVVGSELALASLIRRLGPGKKVDIQNSGPVPRSMSFLPGSSTIKDVKKVDGNYDVVIVFECSGADRMGNIINLETQAKTVINIDHHLHNPNFGHINFVEPTTSSTAELIFKIFEKSGLPIQPDEATCLYTGLVTDTGWFRYSNTNPQTHRIASKLLEAGVPVASLSERVFFNRTKKGVELLAWVLGNMSIVNKDRIAVLRLPEKVLSGIGVTSDDTEDIVNFGLHIDSVLVSVLIKEKPDLSCVKVSLRSKAEYDINKVARHFGGGGHRNASGCTVAGTMDDAEKALLRELENVV